MPPQERGACASAAPAKCATRLCGLESVVENAPWLAEQRLAVKDYLRNLATLRERKTGRYLKMLVKNRHNRAILIVRIKFQNCRLTVVARMSGAKSGIACARDESAPECRLPFWAMCCNPVVDVCNLMHYTAA